MKPRIHQAEGAVWALATVRKYGLAYLSWQERTGKTLTALAAVEESNAKSCLIVTKKKAIPGWLDTLKAWQHSTTFVVTNYESIHKINRSFDFIILDEAHHAISGIGRPSKTWKAVRKHTFKKPILYLSATPYAEHIGLIFHQLRLSDWSPLGYKNFFDFYRKYGIPHMIRTPYGLQDARTHYETEEVLKKIEHLFNFKTRADVGIEVEPIVQVIRVMPTDRTKQFMTEWIERGVIYISLHEILADSDAKKRSVHYQLEGGTLKINDKVSISTGCMEKIKFIKDNYEPGTFTIMAHFIAERALLQKVFPGVSILSSDGDAEGVDLSHVDKLIVYSMSFKTSKHTQRVARQANHNRRLPIVVDILVMDSPGIGFQVYKTVAVKKENFVKNSYERSIR